MNIQVWTSRWENSPHQNTELTQFRKIIRKTIRLKLINVHALFWVFSLGKLSPLCLCGIGCFDFYQYLRRKHKIIMIIIIKKVSQYTELLRENLNDRYTGGSGLLGNLKISKQYSFMYQYSKWYFRKYESSFCCLELYDPKSVWSVLYKAWTHKDN